MALSLARWEPPQEEPELPATDARTSRRLRGSTVAGISDEKLQELRDRVDLVAVVQRRVQLKRSGRDLRGLCPFHGEKTPSFYVVPDKRIFHCFGCGKTGDAIKFVMELEGKSFREAIEQLAVEAGVELAPEDPLEARRSARRAALAEVNDKACTFYERVLWEHPRGKIARDHLAQRGISVETAKAWRLGYAPNLWDALCKSLARGKVDPALVEEAGLGVPRSKGAGKGTLYDRFRGRLTIPIRESGRIVAFGGRLLEGESEAKYLNSPETPLYQKGHVLFALDRAREAVRRDAVALFTEGYFDAIGLHQAGIATAVATCGTAMTERHLELVSRAGAKELVFIFDGDAAGIRAATRASELAAAAGVAARVLVPPDGEDPDETVARVGTQAGREMVVAAQPAIEFLLERELAKLPSAASAESRITAVEAVISILLAVPGLKRDLYLQQVATKIGSEVLGVKAYVERAFQSRQTARDTGSKPLGKQSAAPGSSGGLGRGLPRLAVELELKIVTQALISADLCELVEKSGVSSRFRMADVRDLVERAFARLRAGHLDGEELIEELPPGELQEALRRQMAEASQARHEDALTEQSHLQKMLDRFQRDDFNLSYPNTGDVKSRKPPDGPSVPKSDRNTGQKTGA
jgi:DNA primase